MIRIAIVEDEKIYSEQLKEYLKKYEEETEEPLRIQEYSDGDGIIREYRGQFDIILMDIQMKFMDGMATAREIREMDEEVVILFITNVAGYAIQGYQVEALDYMLKPVTYFDLSRQITRAIMKIRSRESRYLTIRQKSGILKLDTRDIYYVESQGHKLIYHTAGGEYCTDGTLSGVEEQLENAGFYRGNKGYLINMEHVDAVQDKSAVVNGEHLRLGRSKYSGFMQELTKYWGQ